MGGGGGQVGFFREPEDKGAFEATLSFSLSEPPEAHSGECNFVAKLFSLDLSTVHLSLPHRPGKSGRILEQLVSASLQGQGQP